MKEAEFPILIEDLILLGRDQGREEGRAEVRAESARDLREALFTIIAVRQLELSDAQRAQLENERSLERLRAWLSNARNAQSANDLFH